MMFELTPQEFKVLQNALGICLMQMRTEYVHTEARQLRAEFKVDLEQLEALKLRVDNAEKDFFPEKSTATAKSAA